MIYWLRIILFLLDHGSNESVITDESSSVGSFLFDVIAAANARDNGSISNSFDFVNSGSITGVVGVFVICGLLG